MRVVLLAGALLACSAPPRATVTLGRGAIGDSSVVTVVAVATAPATSDYQGKAVQAGPGYTYVVLDCRFAAAVNEVSFDDFQLVRDRVAKLGDEVNLGDNGDADAFYWSLLDPSGHAVAELPGSTNPFMARLAFKVPVDARQGYLFYWGLYWGPLDLTAPVASLDLD